jgi:predicted transposase/invertase (TIGR01784 family)
MSAEIRKIWESEIKKQRDEEAKLDFARKEGELRGEQRGKLEGKIEIAKALLLKGLNLMDISQITGLPQNMLIDL